MEQIRHYSVFNLNKLQRKQKNKFESFKMLKIMF